MIQFGKLFLLLFMFGFVDGQISRHARHQFQPLNSTTEVSVVITMICRNEAVNFRSNLSLVSRGGLLCFYDGQSKLR